MGKKLIITKKISRNLLLKNLREKNKATSVYITFKYKINKEKLKNFQGEKND